MCVPKSLTLAQGYDYDSPFVFYGPHSEGMGKVLFSQVSVCSHFRGGGGSGGTYLPANEGVPMFWPIRGRGGGTYLPADGGGGGTYPGYVHPTRVGTPAR